MKRKIMAFIVLIAQALSLTTIRAENNPSLENSNLERGDLLNWYYNASGSNANLLEIINKDDNPEDVYSGNYSLRVPNISKAWGYNGVTMEGNSAYLVSVMAKANGRTQRASFYSWDSGGRTTDFDILNYHLAAGKPGSGITQGSGTVIGTEWTRVTDVIIAYNSFKPNLSLVDFWNPGEIIIDDLFVEKLRIDDISVEITEEINIPFSGITEITIPKATAKNQLGTTYGLEGANVAYQLNDSYSGVSLDEGNILKISSSVSPGIIELRVTSDPYGDTGSVKYLGVEAYEAIIPVKLLRVENATAELLNKDIVDGVNEIKRDDSFFVKFDYPVNDATITNETIKLINSDTSEEIAIKEFLYNEEDKTVEIVPEADLTSGNYKIVLSKDIRTEDLYEGMTNGWIPLKETIFEFRYFSTNPPVAENVEIIGEGVVGESIYGRYTYKSEENIKENSSYKWYISSEKEGEYKEIPGENGKLLLISEDYQEQFIKFGVTPEDENGYKGEEVLSQAFAMPTVPLAKNVFIGGNAIIGNTLVASYEFVDENGDKEGETIIKWYVSDKKDGEFTLVEGVNGKILKLDESFDGKFIKIEVTSSVGGYGTAAEIDGGKIAAEGTPLTLKNTYTSDSVTLYGIDEEKCKILGAPYEKIRDAYKFFLPDTKAATELILKYPDLFSDYEITKGKMDDVFLSVTGKTLGDEK